MNIASSYVATTSDLYLATPQTNSSTLFGEYIQVFLDSKERTTAACTFKNYKKKIERYIVTSFAGVLPRQISPIQIERWVRTTLGHLSNKSIKEYLTLLNQIFRFALLDDAITVNPMDKIRATKLITLPVLAHEPQPFTQWEISKIATTPTEHVSE